MNILIKAIKVVIFRIYIFFKIILIRIYLFSLMRYAQIESYWQMLKIPRTPDDIRICEPYHDQPILLIALYQRNQLRKDVHTLLTLARAAGFYVMGVNTGVLSEPSRDIFDLYIERNNIGRDFGSYQCGFLYLFKQGLEKRCPRLWMVNDSVFYESSRCPAFIAAMRDTTLEVCGATENFEIQYHLGSFCISMAQSILQNPLFQAFWRDYRLSEMRPQVIKCGEMGLTACLLRCISAPEQLLSLYNMFSVDAHLRTPAHVDAALRLAREGQTTMFIWGLITPKKIWASFLSRYGVIDTSLIPEQCVSMEEAEALMLHHTGLPAEAIHVELTRFVTAQIVDVFRKGSQIHNSNIFLLYLGLPLVKLDLIYRGIFSPNDVLKMISLVSPEEGEALRTLLLSKPFWQEDHKGIEKWSYTLGIR